MLGPCSPSPFSDRQSVIIGLKFEVNSILDGITDVASQVSQHLFASTCGDLHPSLDGQPESYPVMVFCSSRTEPVLAPIRSLISPAAGLDFSPIVLLVGVQLLRWALLPGTLRVGRPDFERACVVPEHDVGDSLSPSTPEIDP